MYNPWFIQSTYYEFLLYAFFTRVKKEEKSSKTSFFYRIVGQFLLAFRLKYLLIFERIRSVFLLNRRQWVKRGAVTQKTPSVNCAPLTAF